MANNGKVNFTSHFSCYSEFFVAIPSDGVVGIKYFSIRSKIIGILNF
jgi:hypothetical protein